MVHTLVEHQPIRIVEPAAPRGEVELRTVLLAVEVVKAYRRLALNERRERASIHIIRRHRQLHSLKRRKVRVDPEIRFPLGQFNVEAIHLFILHHKAHPTLLRTVLYRQVEIPVFDKKFSFSHTPTLPKNAATE